MERDNDLNVELKSEAANDMLSNPPSWLIRSGSGLFLIVLLLVIGLSWFISYPDEIEGSAIVTTSQPPIELSNQAYIQLKTLIVKDQEKVHSGQILAQFDNHAEPLAIEKAKTYTAKLESYKGKLPKLLPLPEKHLQLGSFQQSWEGLVSKLETWNSFHSDNIIPQQIATIRREISYRENLKAIAGKKVTLSETEYSLIAEELESSKRLAEKNAISRQVLNQDKRTETQAMNNVQNQKEMYVQNLISLNDLRNRLVELEHNARLDEQQQSGAILIAIAELANSLYQWKNGAVWLAPCDGKVIFNKLLQVNRYYKPNEASLLVVPHGSGYKALVTIKSEGAGKVKVGQKAFIELADYPKSEYGMIQGKVKGIAQIDKEGVYEVEIQLPNELITTYGKKISGKIQLKGKVKIITKNKRLLSRFFEKLTDLVK